jgi:hypothetical protein
VYEDILKNNIEIYAEEQDALKIAMVKYEFIFHTVRSFKAAGKNNQKTYNAR